MNEKLDPVTKQFLDELEAWASEKGLSLSTISARALADSRGIDRLANTSRRAVGKMRRVREFMENYDREQSAGKHATRTEDTASSQ
jgi:hypothetical protein